MAKAGNQKVIQHPAPSVAASVPTGVPASTPAIGDLSTEGAAALSGSGDQPSGQMPNSEAINQPANVVRPPENPPSPIVNSAPPSPPAPPSSSDDLKAWLADYLIETIQPVQIGMLIKKCADACGVHAAERLTKRFAVVNPRLAGIARIGFEKAAAGVRARQAEQRRLERLASERREQGQLQTAESAA